MKIILGITGGIAAYKAAELLRLLRGRDADVEVVMTEAATRFVAPLTFEALSGKPVHSDQWQGMAHIDLSRGADAILIAPATADFISKIAYGRADDLLSALCLARECPLHIAPAMNRMMWENPATRRNMRLAKADGVILHGPDDGIQACGESGPGRMMEPVEIAERLFSFLAPKYLNGKKFLITAGPTVEAIDPVRAITNFSSGKMGYALARAAIDAGASVILVSGPTALRPPSGAEFIPVVSAIEMREAVMARIREADVFASVAAVADYRVANASGIKIKKEGSLTLELVPNPDILAEVANLENAPFCLGFAAETDHLVEHAEEKMLRKKVDMLAANLVEDAMGLDTNEIVLLTPVGGRILARTSKQEIAAELVREIANELDLR